MTSSATDLRAAAQRLLDEHRTYVFLSFGGHFLDPLVQREWADLEASEMARSPAVLAVVEEVLPRHLPAAGRGIFFPVPISRALEAGGDEDEVLANFRYDLIHVDDDQVWWWRGRKVAPRIQSFFVENLSYEPALDLYRFEYKVNEGWWDKGYLESATTPMLARRLEIRDGSLQVELNVGKWDEIDPASLRLDERERLFCRSRNYGDVLFADWARFEILKGVSEDFQSVVVGQQTLPLRWPRSEPRSG